MDHTLSPFARWPPILYPKSPDNSFDSVYQSMLSRVTVTPQPPPTPHAVPAVELQAVSSRCTHWTNFRQVCTELGRGTGHLLQFFVAQLAPVCAVSQDGQTLVLAGAFAREAVQQRLALYVEQFVQCGTCKSSNTDLSRDREVRRFIVECRDCRHSRAVEGVCKGLRQSQKTERRLARN